MKWVIQLNVEISLSLLRRGSSNLTLRFSNCCYILSRSLLICPVWLNHHELFTEQNCGSWLVAVFFFLILNCFFVLRDKNSTSAFLFLISGLSDAREKKKDNHWYSYCDILSYFVSLSLFAPFCPFSPSPSF